MVCPVAHTLPYVKRACMRACAWRSDNHDNARFLSQNGDRTAYRAALTYVLYSTGIPIVYYGTEQVRPCVSQPSRGL